MDRLLLHIEMPPDQMEPFLQGLSALLKANSAIANGSYLADLDPENLTFRESVLILNNDLDTRIPSQRSPNT